MTDESLAEGFETAAAVQMAAELEPLSAIIDFVKNNNRVPTSAAARLVDRITQLEDAAAQARFRIIHNGGKVTLAECPIGLFISEPGYLCLKSEYGNNAGRIDAYMVDGGSFFWGDHPQTVANQRAQIVQPVIALLNGDPVIVPPRKFHMGQRVRKIKGSSWQGYVCGFYSTALTPIGYDVESERESGSVQLYPEAALEAVPEDED